MVAGSRVFVGALAASLLLFACGGKKTSKTPKDDDELPDPKPKKNDPPAETDADRDAKRLKDAHAIVPEGSNCLPVALKEAGAPRLELGAVADAAMVCAIDQDKSRLLGPVGCFKVNLATSELAYEAPRPIPGIGFAVKMDDRCARGYCLPPNAAVPGDKMAHLVASPDGSKMGVLAGDHVHLFDASTKVHTVDFSIRGDKGVTGDAASIHWVNDALFIEGAENGTVWVFKQDGAPVGGIEVLGGKAGQMVSTKGGSISILDKNRIAIAEQGWSALTIYEVDSGKRTKVNKKLPKAPCKPEEMDAYWKDAGSLADGKCKEHMVKTFGYFIGANGIAGSKNLLIVLRDTRLGELGVIDPKTLAEQKKIIKLPWCGEAAAPPAP